MKMQDLATGQVVHICFKYKVYLMKIFISRYFKIIFLNLIIPLLTTGWKQRRYR